LLEALVKGTYLEGSLKILEQNPLLAAIMSAIKLLLFLFKID